MKEEAEINDKSITQISGEVFEEYKILKQYVKKKKMEDDLIPFRI